MKNSSKVLSLVGLATRAGKTVSGEFSTEKSVKTGKGFLVLVAEERVRKHTEEIPGHVRFL